MVRDLQQHIHALTLFFFSKTFQSLISLLRHVHPCVTLPITNPGNKEKSCNCYSPKLQRRRKYPLSHLNKGSSRRTRPQRLVPRYTTSYTGMVGRLEGLECQQKQILRESITEEMKEGLASVRVNTLLRRKKGDTNGQRSQERMKECKITPRGMITKWFKAKGDTTY